MRRKRLLALIGTAVTIVVVSVYGLLTAPDAGRASPTRTPDRTREITLTDEEPPVGEPQAGEPQAHAPTGPPSSPTPVPAAPAPSTPSAPATPEEAAARYVEAWQNGNLTAMTALVADPPADLTARHLDFDRDLRVSSLSLTLGEALREDATTAEFAFHGVRQVEGFDEPWQFASVLRLTRRDDAWKVLWTPETMHPSLRDGGSVQRTETAFRRPATLTREGEPFPRRSRADHYVLGLEGTVTVPALLERPSGRELLAAPVPPQDGSRSTISRPVQAAAARALDGVGQPAAIVALDVRSRQVLAVADTLDEGQAAFTGLYPPGSTFKIVTAAALLRTGVVPDAPLPCPAVYTVPNGKTFTNDGGADHGTVTLTAAFAFSCNTTFAQQTYERLGGGRLSAEAADRFGFRVKPGLSACRIGRGETETPDELTTDAIGQNSVLASPLCMAEVAAAAASGVWQPAVMTDRPAPGLPAAVPLGDGVAAELRAMMTSVVTEGTAARAGLPPGTAGKTGTAEVGDGASHAWFVGYRDSVAFAVFVRHGGGGGAVAAPIAARFLKAL
ncbi:penicillin-binding transpeptidase domain-containing protein [Streptosporangium sp. NPDC004379]|uniref:penicillin-binding transpeptidase domain-containing protein n=1 Tax=Streptosporangium sp. NPDC004379 TaxID=3366189 RepID=UPI0036A09025